MKHALHSHGGGCRRICNQCAQICLQEVEEAIQSIEPAQTFSEYGAAPYTKLVRLTVKKGCDLAGVRVRDAKLRQRFNLALIAVKRSTMRPDATLNDTILAEGDLILADVGERTAHVCLHRLPPEQPALCPAHPCSLFALAAPFSPLLHCVTQRRVPDVVAQVATLRLSRKLLLSTLKT